MGSIQVIRVKRIKIVERNQPRRHVALVIAALAAPLHLEHFAYFTSPMGFANFASSTGTLLFTSAI